MCSLKRNFYRFAGLLPYLAFSGWVCADNTESATGAQPALHSARFIRLDQDGQQFSQKTGQPVSWRCVLDTHTQLIWEVKTNDGKLQDTHQTYSWFIPGAHINGGYAGYINRGTCSLAKCNTHAYIKAINKLRLCGYEKWRLPSREELRSLVDYTISYPGPVTDQDFFPNTQSQFYWSSIADASDKDSAWGIGFSFGYDYSYFKSDKGYVRLVHEPKK